MVKLYNQPNSNIRASYNSINFDNYRNAYVYQGTMKSFSNTSLFVLAYSQLQMIFKVYVEHYLYFFALCEIHVKQLLNFRS